MEDRPPPNVSQPTFMLNSCAHRLPSMLFSFNIDIPAAASSHHSHSSAHSQVPLQLTRNGTQKIGPKVLKRLTFSHLGGQLIVKFSDSAPS